MSTKIATHYFSMVLGEVPPYNLPAIGTKSRTLKVRGGINSQADKYLSSFGSFQRIFPPQIIQVLLYV